MRKVVEVPEKMSDYMESLQYESDRTKEIVAFMLSSPAYDTTTQTFKNWDRENQEAYVKLRVAKDKLEHEVIAPALEKGEEMLNWNLDFSAHKVTVEVGNAKKD